jgi:hypothetical protein
VLKEFQGKVINAAMKLQQQIADSAEQHPLAGSPTDSAEQPAVTNLAKDVADVPDIDEDSVLADLKARQRKRVQASVAEEQRPAAKFKASGRQSKRTQIASSSSVEQPASARKERRLIAESFAACKAPPTEPDAHEAADSSSAEQPDLDSSSIHDSSAAQPAPQLDGPAEPRSLHECTDWLKALPPQQIAHSKALQRLQSATALLQSRCSRQQRQELQQLLDTWGVPQKAQGRKRKYDEVKADLLTKVVDETRRLRRMQDASATTAGARFSAIHTALQHGSIERLV